MCVCTHITVPFRIKASVITHWVISLPPCQQILILDPSRVILRGELRGPRSQLAPESLMMPDVLSDVF